MDVPFVSSGASSRAHYALVKKVEEETSIIRQNQHLQDAVESTLHKLSSSQLSLKRCREHLITLLYCHTTISSGVLESTALNDAISHAITLAEAGHSIADKRIGYLFCAEIIPERHELQLMLVNTLRKDLESPDVARICLALDHLISSPSEEVIPAIQTRLHDLLSHSSLLVRRRVLLAYKQLSRYSPDVLVTIVPNINRRLKDSDHSVSNAALSLASRTYELHESTRLEIHNAVDGLLSEPYKKGIILRLLRTLQVVGVSEGNLPKIGKVIRLAAKQKNRTLLLETFNLLCHLGPESSLFSSHQFSPINYIREFLTSRDANDQYLFLMCLEKVDPKFWAGTSPEISSVLDQWEVERVMRFLDSPDYLIRRMTIRVLNQVDGSVVEAYYAQTLQQMPPNLSMSNKAEYVCRLLEILEIESQGDGEHYARELQGILQHVHTIAVSDHEGIMEEVIEKVLSLIRIASPDWQLQCATTLLARFIDLEQTDPTMLVILAALACEYIDKVSLPAADLLKSLSSHGVSCPPPVQEMCILAMIRVAATCDEVPQDVLNVVSKIGESGGRRIRYFCAKFLGLAKSKATLEAIIHGAKSSALPDFLESLQSFKIPGQSSSGATSPTAQSPSSRLRQLPSKLRYEAYNPPSVTPRRASSTNSSVRSPTGIELPERSDLSPQLEHGPPRLITNDESSIESSNKRDLIALDSPFITDPPANEDVRIKQIWDEFGPSSNARGWYEGTTDQIIKLVEGLPEAKVVIVDESVPPFEGETKIVVYDKDKDQGLTASAVMRLRTSEEDSCLWQLRGKEPLYGRLKGVLNLTHA